MLVNEILAWCTAVSVPLYVLFYTPTRLLNLWNQCCPAVGSLLVTGHQGLCTCLYINPVQYNTRPKWWGREEEPAGSAGRYGKFANLIISFSLSVLVWLSSRALRARIVDDIHNLVYLHVVQHCWVSFICLPPGLTCVLATISSVTESWISSLA